MPKMLTNFYNIHIMLITIDLIDIKNQFECATILLHDK